MKFSLDQLLIFAARAGNYGVVLERLGKGADVNYWDASHGSAALQALRRGDARILTLLLDHGLAPDGPAALSDPGLIETALAYGQDHVAVMLKKHGFRLRTHARSVYRERLEQAFADQKGSNQSSQATAATLLDIGRSR